MRIHKNFITALLVYFLMNTGISFCQTNTHDQDIAILEGVLDKIIYNRNLSWGWDSKTTGFYLNGFGYLFKTSASRLFYGASPEIAVKVEKLHNLREQLTETRENIDSLKVIISNLKDESINKSQNKDSVYSSSVENIKRNVSDFLLRYASTLKPSFNGEKIAVLVDLNKSPFMNKQQHTSLTAWALISDLNKYLSDNGAGKKIIHFSTGNKKYFHINNQIDIFNEILQKSISGFGHDFSGTYYKGVGAIFFLNVNSLVSNESYNKTLSLIYRSKKDKDSDVFVPMTIKSNKSGDKGSSDKTEKELVNQYKNKIIDAVTKYGHTIDLNPDESIIVVLNVNTAFSFMHKERPPSIIIRADRKDIIDFTKGKISRQNLKNRIKVTNYTKGINP